LKINGVKAVSRQYRNGGGGVAKKAANGGEMAGEISK
jgi:hypothetical protein